MHEIPFPAVSVVIPCYNHGQFIREAIQSVLECENKDLYEIIIVDDGSIDPYTIEVLNQLNEEGYFVIHQKNQGLGAARNKAINEARGRYILPLDCDNRIKPEYITEAVQILDKDKNVGVVYSNAEYFGEKTGYNIVGKFNLQKIMLGNYIDACAVFRKSAWEDVGKYDENMPFMGLEDWDLWLRFSFSGYQFHYIPHILFYYRVQGSSMLRSISDIKYEALESYMQKKYDYYLSKAHLNQFVFSQFQRNNTLILKLFLKLYFPRLSKWLLKKRKIKTENLF